MTSGLRRRVVLLGAPALMLGMPPARAQGTAPIRIVVPFAPGGGNDVFARQMARGLGELRKQTVLVDNKPGVGGNLGSEQVVRAPADGNTLLLGHTGTVSINPALYPKMAFDPQKDLLPVAMFASSALVLVVPVNSPVRSVAELLAQARTWPGGLNYASSGAGTGGHLTGELFSQKTGARMTHVPYKGTAPALSDLVGSQVQLMFSVVPAALAMVKGGRLRALAVTGARRSPLLPEVPAMAESGVASLADFESTLTYGVLAPRGTPETVVKTLSSQMLQVASTADFQSRLDVEGATPLLGGPQEYAALIQRESAKWARIVKVSGATAD